MATTRPTIIATAVYGTDAAASVSFNLPASLLDGDMVLVSIVHVASGTVTNSAGTSFTERAGSSFGSVGLTMRTWYRYVSPSDSSASTTFANTSSTTTWRILVQHIRGGHKTLANFFDQETQATVGGGTGAASITSTTATPSVADCLLETIAGYSVVATAVTDSYNSTTSGGATDSLVTEADSSSAAATRNRGVALYEMSGSPTSGAGTATRTCTLTGANNANHACLTLCIAPQPYIACACSNAVPFSLSAAGSVQVTAAADKALPLTLSAAGSVQVTAALSKMILAAFVSTASVQVTSGFDQALPLSLSAAASAQVSAAFDQAVPFTFVSTASVQVTAAADKALPVSLAAEASAQVTAALSQALPLALAADGTAVVQVTAAFDQAVPFTLASAGSVQVTAALDKAVALALSSAGSVQVDGALDQVVPLSLSAAASAQVTAAFSQAVPLTGASAASVQVSAALSQSLPLVLAADATAVVQVTAAFNQALPFSIGATASVQVTGAFDQPLPLGCAADGITQLRLAIFDQPLPLGFIATGRVEKPRLKFADISHTMGRYTMKQIDLSRDYTFQIDVTQPSAATGDDEAAAGITGWTAHIALSASGAAVHPDLSKDLVERSETPGRYYCQFDQVDLTANLSLYAGRYAWIVVTKSGDLASKNFKRLLVAHVDGDDV